MIILIILIIIIIFILYKSLFKNVKNVKNVKNNNHIKILLRQISRWGVAAEQDESPMIAVLHANYAVGYLQALTDIATEKEINKYLDFDKFKWQIYKIQDDAVKKAVKVCPQYIGNINKELALLGISL
jgi:competence protein ComGC